MLTILLSADLGERQDPGPVEGPVVIMVLELPTQLVQRSTRLATIGDLPNDPFNLRPCPGPVRQDALPPLRAQRAETARNLTRAVAELRLRPPAWRAAGHHPARIRSWRDPF